METELDNPIENMSSCLSGLRFLGLLRDDEPVVSILTYSLTNRDRPKINAHLLRLSPRDRYLRFGYSATDAQIGLYVSGLNTQRDEFFALFDANMDIVAMAHLAIIDTINVDMSCEFGVSVNELVRGRGYGAMLFDRAVIHARNRGALGMVIHALSENTAMLKIAKKAGATLVRDGPDTQAYLKLPSGDFDSQFKETVINSYSAFSRKIGEDAKMMRSVFKF